MPVKETKDQILRFTLTNNNTTLKHPFLIWLFISLNATAQQNLVPNGSFEDTTGCPSFYSELHYTTHWWGVGTPDLLHTCAWWSNEVWIPLNVHGTNFQEPFHGNAYVAIGTIWDDFWSPPAETKEYLAVELTDSMYQDSSYCIRYYVVSSDSHALFSNGIDALLTDSLIPASFSTTTLGIIPSGGVNSVINDFVNWTRVEFLYQANGGEKYLYIGNFMPDSNTIVQLKPPESITFQSTDAIYFIDSVSVIQSPRCPVWPQRPVGELLFPNIITANGDGKNDQFKAVRNSFALWECTIYNRWGKVMTVLNPDNAFWEPDDASDGVYYYVFVGRNEPEQPATIRKGTVQVLH